MQTTARYEQALFFFPMQRCESLNPRAKNTARDMIRRDRAKQAEGHSGAQRESPTNVIARRRMVQHAQAFCVALADEWYNMPSMVANRVGK